MAWGDYTCVNQNLIDYEQGVNFEEPGLGNGDLLVPRGIEWHNGVVWVADSGHCVIRKYSDAGEYLGASGKWKHCWEDENNYNHIEFRIGWLSSSQGDMEGEMGCGIVNGIASEELGAFNSPMDLDYDSADQIYVLDQGNNRIEVLDQGGACHYSWGEEGEDPGTFHNPIAIAVDDL